MARLHSGLGDRTVYTAAGLAKAQGFAAKVYEDPAGTILASLAVYDPTSAAVPGAAIPGAALVVDAFSNRPAFWDLADRDVLYITVAGGPLEPIRPDAQPQVTALATRVGTVEDGVDALDGRVGTVEGVAAAAETPAGAQAKANAVGARVPLNGAGALIRRLETSLWPTSALLLGDSTGNATDEWFYGLTAWLAGQFVGYRTRYQLWDDASQAYGQPTVLGAGSGTDRYITVPANAGVRVETVDSAATSPTGDFSVRCRIALDDWTPSAQTDIAGKVGSAGNRSWWIAITTSGFINLSWSNDGTAIVSKSSTAAVPFADGATGWIRVDLDVDNGSAGNTVTFYTSTNGTTWTQLGSPVVTAGITTVFDGTSTTQFVARTGGTWTATGGRAYAMQVYSGTTLVIDMDMGTLATGATTMTDYTGNSWTVSGSPARTGDLVFAVYNASVSGQNVSYATDSTRQPKLLGIPPADVVFVSYGHNEGTGVTYAGYSTLTSALLARWPQAGIVPVLQNPETAPQTQAHIDAHAMRLDLVASLAAASGWPVVDAYRAIINDGRPLTDLILDGTHPTAAGTAVWLAEAQKLLTAWMGV